MAGDEVRVDPDDLRAKAGQIEAILWGNNPVEIPTVPADALNTSQTAVDNLNQNAKTLADYQEYGKKQGQRLAESLRLVADAYATVDQNASENISNTIAGGSPTPPAPVTPRANTVPAPTAPPPLPIQRGMTAENYMEVKSAQGALMSGDQAASLQAAATTWATNGTTLATAAEGFELSTVNWEGEAADAAYRSFNDYQAFLVELSGAWNELASEAERVASAHFNALSSHTEIAEQYAALEAQLPAAIANGGSAARVIQLQMEKLQNESEELRHQYARAAQPDEVNPPEPPNNTGTPPIPVKSNGDPRKRAGTQNGQGGGSAGGGQQLPSSGGSGGSPPAASQDAPVSPTSAAEQASQGAQQGGQQGGSQGGGQQGGGSPGGGQPGAGMPGAGKGDPKLPTDPSLRPAAAGRGSGGGGGASGGGAGGGGGGGGVPSSPRQPAVGAETVAPTPMVAPVAPAAAAAGPAAGGAAGGGMGGIAPMHGAPGGGSGEKKRNPQLAQDEELYTEERPWTEAVIGNRVRRRGAPDDTKKESQ